MEKTKFEKECEQLCAECRAKEMDICSEDVDTVEPMFSRCGICGKVYCEYSNCMVQNHLCDECSSLIAQNVDKDEEIINPNKFIINN